MQRYNIIVSVEAADQLSAFTFVEDAIDKRLDAQRPRITPGAAVNTEDGAIRVSTQDGTKSTTF